MKGVAVSTISNFETSLYNTVFSLIDTLVADLDNYELEELPPQFEEQFPQTITVGQAVATWKAIVFYQQQHEHDIKD